jgi:hypothetical protein
MRDHFEGIGPPMFASSKDSFSFYALAIRHLHLYIGKTRLN